MPGWFDIGNIWKTLREIDLRPIRAQAERVTWITVVGQDERAKAALVAALCEKSAGTASPSDAGQSGPGPVSLSPAQASGDLTADLIVLILDSTHDDGTQELDLVEKWRVADKRVVVIADRPEAGPGLGAHMWQGARLLFGSTCNRNFIEREFVLAALSLLPENHLSLARHYPLFRLAAARQLIAETSMANASYSLSTGLAEIVPILDLPFNVADMIVLTKAQALMAYKLGLALGLSGDWHDHMAAFGSTIGSGFLWRQVARQLVGLIPVWGIIPKVAVAYAGTYVLGQAILQWYLTGRQVTPAMMRQLYQDAFEQGKGMARTMLRRAPRGRNKLRLAARASTICPNCGATNPAEFNFCGRCGTPLRVTG